MTRLHTCFKAVLGLEWRLVSAVTSLWLFGFIEMGVVKSYGVLIDDIVFQLHSDLGTIGMILGVFHGMSFFIGPLVDAAYTYLTLPWIVTIGLIGGLSLCASAFVTTALQMSAAMFVSGMSYAFVILAAYVRFKESVPSDKYALLYSIGDAGNAVGIVVVPILAEFLRETYGWRGTVLLLGGMYVNTPLLLYMMKAPKSGNNGTVKTTRNNGTGGSGGNNGSGGTGGNDGTCGTGGNRATDGAVRRNEHANDETDETEVSELQPLLQESNEDLIDQDDVGIIQSADISLEREPHPAVPCGIYETDDAISLPPRVDNTMRIYNTSDLKTITSSHADEKLPNHSHKRRENLKTSTPVDSSLNLFNLTWKFLMNTFVVSSLTKEPYFVLFYCKYIIDGAILTAWVVFLIPHGVSKGYPLSRVVFLASFGGIGNILGSLLQGPILHMRWLSSLDLIILHNAINGAAFFLDPVAASFWVLSITAFVGGFTIGGRMTTAQIFVQESYPGDDFSSATALSWVFFAAGQPIGGLVTGWLADNMSYSKAFLVLGAVEIAGCFLLISFQYFYNHRKDASK